LTARDLKATDQIILECAIEIIDEHGEAAVRIADITERTGVSISSIYHFFSDREGLLAAAQVERYIVNMNELFGVVCEWLTPAETREEFRDAFIGLFRSLLVPERAPGRLVRLNAMGGVVGRPSLGRRLAEIQDDLVNKLADLLVEPLEKGWIRADTDPVATVSWLIGIYMQRVLIEMGPSSVDPESWNKVAMRSIVATVFDEIEPLEDLEGPEVAE
jgi:AcrR family transcriptional regulator